MSARGAGSMVKRQMHNLRQLYRWLLRDEVAHIVQDPADVNDEIRYLSPCWQRVINLIPHVREVTPLAFSSGGTRTPQWPRLASRASSLCPGSRICGSYLPEANR